MTRFSINVAHLAFVLPLKIREDLRGLRLGQLNNGHHAHLVVNISSPFVPFCVHHVLSDANVKKLPHVLRLGGR